MERKRRFLLHTVGSVYPDTDLILDLIRDYNEQLSFLEVRRFQADLLLRFQMKIPMRLKPLCEYVKSRTLSVVESYSFENQLLNGTRLVYTHGHLRTSGGDRKSQEAKNAKKPLAKMTKEEMEHELFQYRIKEAVEKVVPVELDILKVQAGSVNIKESSNCVVNSNNTTNNITNNNITVHAYNYESIAHITTQEWQRLVEEGALHTDGLGHFAIIALEKVWELPANRNVRISGNDAQVALPDGSYQSRSIASIVAETPKKMANFARAASRVIPEVSQLRSLPEGNLTVDKEGNHYECDYNEHRQVVPGSVRPVVDTDLVGEMEGSWPNANKGALKMRNGLNTKRKIEALGV